MSSLIRVGHLVDCFGAGGIASGVFTLIQSTEKEIDHTIISLSEDLRLLSLLSADVPAYVIKPGPTKLAGFSARLGLLAQKLDLDVLHCNNHFAWLDTALAARASGRRCLETFHGVEMPVGEIGAMSRLKCRIAACLGDRISAVGEASRRMVCKLSGVPEWAVEVIPNGIDVHRFKPMPQDDPRRTELRVRLGVATDTTLVVHIAGLRPVKDQATLLHAWRLVGKQREGDQGPESLLLLVGEGECREELLALSTKLGISTRVRFLGQRRDVDSLLPACDIFVLSSISEGLSFAVLEAMACGLPVVATEVGGNGELVADGETGLLVPARDFESLASALGELLHQPEKRINMGINSRYFVNRNYDNTKMADRYIDLYHKLAYPYRKKRINIMQEH